MDTKPPDVPEGFAKFLVELADARARISHLEKQREEDKEDIVHKHDIALHYLERLSNRTYRIVTAIIVLGSTVIVAMGSFILWLIGTPGKIAEALSRLLP